MPKTRTNQSQNVKGFEKTFRKTVMDRDETGMYGKLQTQGFQNWSHNQKWAKIWCDFVRLKKTESVGF